MFLPCLHRTLNISGVGNSRIDKNKSLSRLLHFNRGKVMENLFKSDNKAKYRVFLAYLDIFADKSLIWKSCFRNNFCCEFEISVVMLTRHWPQKVVIWYINKLANHLIRYITNAMCTLPKYNLINLGGPCKSQFVNCLSVCPYSLIEYSGM